MRKISEFLCSDIIVRYTVDDQGIAAFSLLPAGCEIPAGIQKSVKQENMVQLYITGDIHNQAYAGGISMRCGESTERLLYDRQDVCEDDHGITVTTYLRDKRGYEVKHVLRWKRGAGYIILNTIFTNQSELPVSLEMLSSFSLSGLTPYVEGDAHESMDLYRIRSVWSGEGRLSIDTVEDLCLEKCWTDHAVRSLRYGVAGSMPVNGFFPFGAMYDKKNHIFWGAQLAHNASWQMEFYRKDEGLSFSGGLADREFGHWMKTVKQGEVLETPTAILSVMKVDREVAAQAETEGTHADFDEFAQRMTQYGLDCFQDTAPASEKELPVIFNEYCTTWGNPSHENIKNILQAIRGRGFSYFVIDCGWYKQEGIPWDRGMGDYEVSSLLFPDGLEQTVNMIKEEGLKPGIWFEIENVASEAKAYQLTDHLLHRDGKVLTSYSRRFWNMSDPWVMDYLTDRVIGTLKKYGFEYMKMDYNETTGIGCDGPDDLGENLRQVMNDSVRFIQKVKSEVPEIILENCASGGHRLEPLMMSLCSMASFSDAHECIEIPLIAAYLHRVIHPAQSQIWAVIRKEDTLRRITYSLAATMLGRMCISGDVTELSVEQWKTIDDGIAFYKTTSHIIHDGISVLHGSPIKSMRHPRGWQAVVRSTGKESLVVIHTFDGDIPECIEIPLHKRGIAGSCVRIDSKELVHIAGMYAADDSEQRTEVCGDKLVIHISGKYNAMAVHVTW
ncbi:MAG: alpha-galactosidase [bacterium]|nr:alpha-galactosidase [bacterium]